MMAFFLAALVAALIFSAWQWVRILESACQFFFDRSALADRESSRPSSPSGEDASPARGSMRGPQGMVHDAEASPPARLLSSSLPARRSADLGSAGFGPPLSLGAIAVAPDFEAFGLGLELMVFTALFTIGALLVLNWIIKTMRGSS